MRMTLKKYSFNEWRNLRNDFAVLSPKLEWIGTFFHPEFKHHADLWIQLWCVPQKCRPPPPICEHHSVYCWDCIWLSKAGTLCGCTWLAPLFLTFSQSSYDGLLSKELDLNLLKLFHIYCQWVACVGPCLGLTPGCLAFSWGTSLPSGFAARPASWGCALSNSVSSGACNLFLFSCCKNSWHKTPPWMFADLVGKRKSSLRIYFWVKWNESEVVMAGIPWTWPWSTP